MQLDITPPSEFVRPDAAIKLDFGVLLFYSEGTVEITKGMVSICNMNLNDLHFEYFESIARQIRGMDAKIS